MRCTVQHSTVLHVQLAAPQNHRVPHLQIRNVDFFMGPFQWFAMSVFMYCRVLLSRDASTIAENCTFEGKMFVGKNCSGSGASLRDTLAEMYNIRCTTQGN